MSAATTVERITYECRPYTVGREGATCGGCRDPMTAAPGLVLEVRAPFSVLDGDAWRRETDAEYREMLHNDIGECIKCHQNPADFPVFTNTARVVVEHTVCRIF